MPPATDPIRLLPPRAPAALPAPDDAARAVMERVAGHGNTVVLGAAGTGKTTLALRALSRAVAAGRDALLLAPTRQRADQLRARAAHLLGQGHGDGVVRVRTPAALALTILTASLTRRPDPLPAPVLLAGAEEDAALAAMVGATAWPGIAAEAVASRAFRSELRNLLARAGELGVDAQGLARLGRELGVPLWGPASELLRAWDAQGRPTAELRSRTRKVDTARLQDRAAEALGTWEADAVLVPRPVPDLVIVDDYQDCTAATARLLTALARPDAAGHRAQVLVLGDPDTAVETFRGGTPSLLIEAEDRSGLDAERMVLTTRYRGNPALVALWEDQSARLPVTGTGSHRRPAARGLPGAGDPLEPCGPCEHSGHDGHCERGGPGGPDAPAGAGPHPPAGAGAIVAASTSQEAAHAARMLRGEHIHHATPWGQMAVIVRSADQGGAVARELRRRGVPVTRDTPAVLLRAEPAAAALLEVAGAGLGGQLGRHMGEPGWHGDRPSHRETDPGSALRSDLRSDPESNPGSGPRRAPVDRGAAMALLTGALIGLSSLDLRRLRRRLRAEQQDPGAIRPDTQDTQDPLLDLLVHPGAARSFYERVAQEPLAQQARLVVRAARVMEAVRQAVAAGGRGTGVESLLWAAWSASGRAEAWRALALEEGPGGTGTALSEAAERDLDVVTALFKRAEVWAERHPGAPASQFLAELAAEVLPSDSVAPQGVRPLGVSVLTPAAAAGRQWQVVVVMGLTTDSWPDLRLRDSITRSGLLVDAVAGRLPQGGEDQADPALARAQVRADERRMLLAALTRATRRLLVTATADAEHSPSSFHTEIALATGTLCIDEEGAALPAQDVGDLTLRGLVGELRSAAIQGRLPRATPAERHRGQQACLLLARLAAHRVPGADPRTWAGTTTASSRAPLVAPGERIRISPSDVESIAECPLRWFLQRHGGRGPATSAQALGTLIHHLAERAEREQLRGPALMEALEAELPALGYPRTWLGARAAQRARDMVERLEGYLQGVPGGAQVEVPIGAEIDLPGPPGSPSVPVALVGRIDRLERAGTAADPQDRGGTADHREPERVRVVDIKTGKTPHPDPEHHPQLAAYRLALEDQGYDVVGGGLVLLGKAPAKRDGLTVISPPGAALAPSPDPDSGQDWARDLVRRAALDAVGPSLQARTGSHCRTCRLKDSCPLQPEGRRVVA